MVERRCAMANEVLPSRQLSNAACTTVSEAESNAEVASSRIMIAGSRTRARQMAKRCFWPPDSRLPFGPTAVSMPSGPKKSILAISLHFSSQAALTSEDP
mmetsp:Transcript_79268/g.212013  ORF Transcript_79268/g.212013 Transcript_79268/m.212013 type:complete len:100 (-) Transcript_79268:3393-3692(-)